MWQTRAHCAWRQAGGCGKTDVAIEETINAGCVDGNLWYIIEWLYPLKRVHTELVQRPFYLPYMGFRDFADRFDTLSNLLAILTLLI